MYHLMIKRLARRNFQRLTAGNWTDNVFIERLWRSMKYECIYLNAFDSIRDAQDAIGNWMTYYNEERPHSTFGDRTPSEVYTENLKQAA